MNFIFFSGFSNLCARRPPEFSNSRPRQVLFTQACSLAGWQVIW